MVATTRLPVPDPSGIASVSVVPTSGQINIGGQVQLSATVVNNAGATVTPSVSWSSSAPAVATVSSSGLVSGVSEVQATITATQGDQSGTATVSVNDPNPPAEPSGLVARPLSDTSIELTWEDNSDNETGFVIERETVDPKLSQP